MAGTCGGYKQFNKFSTTSPTLPTVDPGPPAFYENTIATASSNAVLLIQEGTSPPGGPTWTWTGSINTNWHEPCNWDKESVPNTTSLVVIPGSTPTEPVISTGNADCYSLDINSTNGGTLDIQGTRVLTISQP